MEHIDTVYMCDCGSEGIVIHDLDELQEIDLSIVSYGFRNKLSIKDRIKYCYRILKEGRPYLDQICLNYDTARELVSKINDLLGK